MIDVEVYIYAAIIWHMLLSRRKVFPEVLLCFHNSIRGNVCLKGAGSTHAVHAVRAPGQETPTRAQGTFAALLRGV
jgi:hypothetical protein